MEDKKKSILIVDDDEAVQSTMRELLEGEGYQVSVASDGAEALKKLLAEEIAVDLILLDLYMPEMDGWHFAHYLRKYGSAVQRKIPIIITSATDSVSEEDIAMTFQHFLHKPFSLENLISTCDRFSKSAG